MSDKEETTPFETAIDILSGRITELEAKLNETQGKNWKEGLCLL